MQFFMEGKWEMKEKGWRPFWAALLAALLVLLPLVGGTVLLPRRSLRTRLASRPQSGVAIRQPKEENRLSLLVCIAPTETTAPGFLLLYLNASQNCIHALALPGELTVPFGADETALSDCYRAAGPARCPRAGSGRRSGGRHRFPEAYPRTGNRRLSRPHRSRTA